MTSNKTNELDTFDEQRFLIDLLPFFADLKGSSIYELYDNLGVIPPGKENTTFLADLDSTQMDGTTIKRSNLLSRLPKQLISSLHPKVEMYKVTYEGARDFKGHEVKFPLNNVQTPDQNMLGSRYKGKPPGQLAVGLKKFDFDYLGTNPAEVETFIDCNLTLYFSSVDALFHTYGTGDNEISFLDFIKRPKRSLRKEGKTAINPYEERHFNPKYFRIRVDISYEEPVPGFIESAVKELKVAGIQGIEADAVKQEIENNRVSFFLTLVRHNVRPLLDVPSGPFEMDITFNASVETAFSSPEANLLVAGATEAQQKDINDANETTALEQAREILNYVFNGASWKGDFSPTVKDSARAAAGGHGRQEDLIDTLAHYEFEDFFSAKVIVSSPREQRQNDWVVDYNVAAKAINANLWESVLGVNTATLTELMGNFGQEFTSRPPFATGKVVPPPSMGGPYLPVNRENLKKFGFDVTTIAHTNQHTPIFKNLGQVGIDFETATASSEIRNAQVANTVEGTLGSGNVPTHKLTGVDTYRGGAAPRTEEIEAADRQKIKQKREYSEKTSDGVFADNPFANAATERGLRSVLYDYFRARQRVELLKQKYGITARQLRTSSYNRFIAQLMRTVGIAETARKHTQAAGTIAPMTAPNALGSDPRNYTKVVRTPVRRALIMSYNKNRLRSEFTERELTQYKAAADDDARRAVEAKRSSRQGVFKNFLKGLIYNDTGGFTGNQFGTTTDKTLTRDLQDQQAQWYSEIQRDLAPEDKRKLPEFAIAKPKINVKDADGVVDLRWVYFGDMVDTAIQILITENNRLRKELHFNLLTDRVFNGMESGVKDALYVAMGNFEYTDLHGKAQSYPLAHFPIPLRNIVAWWTTKVVEPQLTSYSLRTFIKDALLDLVVKPLNTLGRPWPEAKEDNYKPHVEVMSISTKNTTAVQAKRMETRLAAQYDAQYTAYEQKVKAWEKKREPRGPKPSEPIKLADEPEHNRLMVFDSCDNTGPKKKQELFFIGIQKTAPKHLFENNRTRDREKGILYLEMKREGTPLYSIKFNRSDEPFQLEARADRTATADGLQLSEVYNVDFTTVGNMGLKPGRLIYISDPHFGDINNIVKKFQNKSPNLSQLYEVENAARLLGIGGYFLLTKTRHTIKQVGDRFDWRSSATGFWVSFGKEIGPKK